MEALKIDEFENGRTYTVADIEALPEGERAELTDGNIYYMASPSRTHQRILSKLNQTIGNYIDSHNGSCEVYPAPFAVYLNNDDTNYYEPDISVICDTSKLDEKGCHGAPDWIIEIVSQGNKARDYFTKLFKYQAAGVREYWIVDPTRELVFAYQFENEVMEQYSFGEAVPVGIYEGFSIKVEMK